METSNLSWEEQLFKNTFEATVRSVQFHKKVNKNFSLEDLEHQLEALYVIDGNNYIGRGIVGDTDLAATIAALQYMISVWHT